MKRSLAILGVLALFCATLSGCVHYDTYDGGYRGHGRRWHSHHGHHYRGGYHHGHHRHYRHSYHRGYDRYRCD